MRAGLTLRVEDILKKGRLAMFLSFIPYMCEFAVMTGFGMYILGWNATDMGLLASILAALSPSLVIPGMIKFVGEKLGYTPTMVLTAAPIEVVLAIILFNIFTNLEQTSRNSLYPWVTIFPLWANILLIPANIILSTILGVLPGYAAVKYFEFRSQTENDQIKRAVPWSTSEGLFVLITLCYTFYALCQMQYIQQSSGVLAVFSMALTVSYFAPSALIENFKAGLAGLWVFVEVFLFTTVGINLALKSETGPLQSQRGVSHSQLTLIIGILLLGTLGRSAGVALSEVLSYHSLPPHRRSYTYMTLFWLTTWIFQIPKATVQATLGGLPYSQHIIDGSDGLTKGLFILRVTAFSVLFMATIGVFLTGIIGYPIAKYLRELDDDAGYDVDDNLVEKDKKPVDDLVVITLGPPKEADDQSISFDNPSNVKGGYELVVVSEICHDPSTGTEAKSAALD